MIQSRGLAVALLCLSVLLGGCQAGFMDRILGGDEAGATDTPYAASLRVDNAHVCGATIVSETKLVTTAHCLYRDKSCKIDISRLSCRVGSTNQYAGGRIVYVASVAVHPDYYDLKNNVAVVTLTSALTFTDRIRAAELASGDEDLPAQGSTITVAGWGRTLEGSNSYKIRELSLILAEEAVCQDAYKAHDKSSFCLVHALKQGTCHGDGGSGAIYNGKLVGLTNFVVGACGARYPDVFVRIASFHDWLQQQIIA